MTANMFDALPETVGSVPLRGLVTQAVVEAFPQAPVTAMERIQGGMSGAFVCKITVNNRPYVLRALLQRGPLADPVRQFTCMRIAADRGIAPRVHYANAELGVSIADFIQPQVSSANGEPTRMAPDPRLLGAMLRTLHTGPAFPAARTAFEMLDDGIADLTATVRTVPTLHEALFAQHQTIRAVLSSHVTLAPCHNDLNPGNVLFDGARTWLVDWDAACQGDPLYDLAGLIHWLDLSGERLESLLTAYFDGAPTTHERAKLTLMKQVSWCVYSLIFLLISRREDGVGDLDAIVPDSLPTFSEARAQIPAGVLKIHEAEGQRRLSLVMAQQSLRETAAPDFQDAMALLRTSPSRGSPLRTSPLRTAPVRPECTMRNSGVSRSSAPPLNNDANDGKNTSPSAMRFTCVR